MSEEWYVYKDGGQQGPYPWEQLWQLAHSGAIQPGDHVWKDGMDDWTPAEQIPGLIRGAPSSTRPPSSTIADGPPPPSAASPPRPDLPGAGAPYPAAPVKKGRTWVWVAAILGAVVIASGACGAAYLLFFRDSGLLADLPGAIVREPDAAGLAEASPTAAVGPVELEQPTPEPTLASPTETMAATAEPATEPPPQPTPTEPGEADGQALDPPGAVVDAFILATLGTVPGAAVDDDMARSLMTEGYAAEFDSPEFVPMTYGIQDGPDSYEIASEDIFEPTARVVVLGYYGSNLGRQWRFALVREYGVWRVSGIDVLEEESAGDGIAQSPFWQLNPVVIDFTVYGNGGWKLVAEFDEPPQDIDAQFRIEYLREDDGSLAYAQEDSGVIEAGRERLTLDSDWTGYDLSQLGFKPGLHQVVAYIDGVRIAEGQLAVE